MSAACGSLWRKPWSSLLFSRGPNWLDAVGERWSTGDVFQCQAPGLLSSTAFSSRICLDCSIRPLPVWFLVYLWEPNPCSQQHLPLTMLGKACLYHPHLWFSYLREEALAILAEAWEPQPPCPWLDSFSQAPDSRVRSSSPERGQVSLAPCLEWGARRGQEGSKIATVTSDKGRRI